MDNNIEQRLKELLVPILGLDSADEISSDSALVRDLGAESIDYIEILYAIENEFGVKINMSEISSYDCGPDGPPADGRLTEKLAERINSEFGGSQLKAGMTTTDIFQLISVHNIAVLIEKKLA